MNIIVLQCQKITIINAVFIVDVTEQWKATSVEYDVFFIEENVHQWKTWKVAIMCSVDKNAMCGWRFLELSLCNGRTVHRCYVACYALCFILLYFSVFRWAFSSGIVALMCFNRKLNPYINPWVLVSCNRCRVSLYTD